MTHRTIDWEIVRQAYALLGYQFTIPEDHLDKPPAIQLAMWDMFRKGYMSCQLLCADKGGGPCIHTECPRVVLCRVSLTALTEPRP